MAHIKVSPNEIFKIFVPGITKEIGTKLPTSFPLALIKIN